MPCVREWVPVLVAAVEVEALLACMLADSKTRCRTKYLAIDDLSCVAGVAMATIDRGVAEHPGTRDV
jgi:hypothetical protein